MATHDDVEYLRGVVASYRHKLDEIRNQAAGARIAELEAEVDRLRGENERLREMLGDAKWSLVP